MPLRYFLLRALVLLTLFSAPGRQAAAQASLDRLPGPFDREGHYVSDPNKFLKPATIRYLEANLYALDMHHKAHIQVVMVRSIGKATPHKAAAKLFDRWKIEKTYRHNGLLVLVVQDQGWVEFYISSGLQQTLTLDDCKRVGRRYMVLALQQKKYDKAIRSGVDSLIHNVAPDFRLFNPDAGEVAEAFPPDVATLARIQEQDSLARIQEQDSLAAAKLAFADRSGPGNWRGDGMLVFFSVVLMFVTTGVLLSIKHVPVVLKVLVSGVSLWILAQVIRVSDEHATVPSSEPLAWTYGWSMAAVSLHLLVIRYRYRQEYAGASRIEQYTYLVKAHRRLGFLRFMMPIPLVLYWIGHRRQLSTLRNEPYQCPECTGSMYRLAKNVEHNVLQPSQKVEESIKALDYDAWECYDCQHHLVLGYLYPKTKAKECPNCSHTTLQRKSREVVERGNRRHRTWGWIIWECAFCQHIERVYFEELGTQTSSHRHHHHHHHHHDHHDDHC
ncbi:TPM domain-containing protein [Hymenobacter cellulosilyticus]|uniref:TPM domain-containing protein n=1 Tax=Hymenobacter cellulosilyticus TaxID=2932248 RepID=A0A8T9Q5M8_9BACT|nr:TPM domain-containing protein [Hymenobacter cellulosilyticus]UOQ72874.1 TPM domain-containing protein [Hymenobacter cellulosilyticus]